MNFRTKSAGDILDAHCTRCRLLTNHTIIALVDGVIARVKCNTCGSEHKYHQPKEDKAPPVRRVSGTGARTTSSAPAKKEPPVSSREQWETATSGMDRSLAREYDMAGKFKKDELVSHAIFGIGMVTMVAGTKMEALFADGLKLLRCGK